MKWRHNYLVHIQYLGFRFHGWAKQPNQKTVHLMIDKTVAFVLDHSNFKTLGVSRTDAMVSANHSVFQLMVNEPLSVCFLENFNMNLPADIKALKIEEKEVEFNVIQAPVWKEYIYIFSHSEKANPFSASMISSFVEKLDIDLMIEGATVFVGQHNFQMYCATPSENTNFERTILESEILDNASFSAGFFPKSTFVYRVRSKGFMRNQVRLMMGQLIQLGKGNISLAQLKESLEHPSQEPLRYIAPASGLILNKIEF